MRYHIGSYEGILQLRNPTKDIKDFVKKFSKEHEGLIVDEIKVENGIDYLFASQKLLQTIGRRLNKSFPGELIISRKLFTVKRETMKRVYRLSVLFRMPLFKKGDKIKYKGREYIVKAIGKKVLAADSETGKKANINYKDVVF